MLRVFAAQSSDQDLLAWVGQMFNPPPDWPVEAPEPAWATGELPPILQDNKYHEKIARQADTLLRRLRVLFFLHRLFLAYPNQLVIPMEEMHSMAPTQWWDRDDDRSLLWGGFQRLGFFFFFVSLTVSGIGKWLV